MSFPNEPWEEKLTTNGKTVETGLTVLDELREAALDGLDMHEEIDDDALKWLIFTVIENYRRTHPMTLRERIDYGKELFNTFRKLDVLQELLEDDEITEIMINGTNNIFIEQDGKISCHEKHFSSREKLENVIQQIVGTVNRTANERNPIADARLEDGSRVNVVLRPIALSGPVVTIRKFPKHPITMDDLLAYGSINEACAEFLKKMVRARYNIFISGGTGSGKTTFLNALSEFIPDDERIITIEDNAELQLRHIPNLVRLEAREANAEGAGEIPIRALIKTALRMRPDRIIVGEVRSGEAIDMLQAMNTGHDGSLSTGHANSPKDMISRLETMVLGAMEIPLEAVDRQIGAAVDLIIHLARFRDGSRKVAEVVEVTGYVNGRFEMNRLFHFEEEGEHDGRIKGTFVHDGTLVRTQKLLAAGC